MTEIEALHWCEDFQINILTAVHNREKKHELAVDAMDRAKAAIARRIPIVPNPYKVDCNFIMIGNGRWCKGTTVYKCPCCDTFTTMTHQFCYKCGQALDWGKDND